MQSLFPDDTDSEQMDSLLWLHDSFACVESAAEEHEFSKDLCRLLNELPDVYRSVLILFDIYKLDYSEAANSQKIPIGTVKSRLARARLRLSKKLCQLENTPFRLVIRHKDWGRSHDHSLHSMIDHSKHNMVTHSDPIAHQGHDMATMPKEGHSAHAGHSTDHTGHEQMFRVRF